MTIKALRLELSPQCCIIKVKTFNLHKVREKIAPSILMLWFPYTSHYGGHNTLLLLCDSTLVKT